MILAGDVGGTKTNLGWFEVAGDRVRVHRVQRFESAGRAGLEELLDEFLQNDPRPIDAACLGIAGPVVGDRVDATNLPWSLSAPALARKLGLSRVELVNDLVATAEGLPALVEDDVEVLAPGRPEPGGAEVVVAAGTGLGVAFLVTVEGERVALPSEAGHAEFAPRDETQAALARHLRRRYGRASVERVVSGRGLVDAYGFLAENGGGEDEEFERRWREEDRGKLVTDYALAGRSERCRRALDLFLAAYGAVAGDLALTALALGGVWIGGGIAPSIAGELRGGPFRASFLDKGRFREMAQRVPVRLILNPSTALLGAARRAARFARAAPG